MERNMKFKDIELPDELMPSEDMVQSAKEQDQFYEDMYEQLRKDQCNASASDVIGLLAKIRVEQVALLIGANLRDYDKEILMSIIERHIAGRVFRG